MARPYRAWERSLKLKRPGSSLRSSKNLPSKTNAKVKVPFVLHKDKKTIEDTWPDILQSSVCIFFNERTCG